MAKTSVSCPRPRSAVITSSATRSHCSIPTSGRTAIAIIHTDGPEHRRRLYLGGLLARLLVAAREAGLITEIPDRLRLVLVMHFSRADLPGFRDFHQLKRLVDSIRGTYATSERPLVRTARLPSGRRVRCSITVRDTLLLAPAGFGSLAALGEACGLEKLKLGSLADGTPSDRGDGPPAG